MNTTTRAIAIILATSALALVACLGSEGEESLPSLSASGTEAASPSPSRPAPSMTPHPTSSLPTPTEMFPTIPPRRPTPALPISDDDRLQLSQIVFQETSPDCTLPCWNELRIGESNIVDVQAAFNRAFAFPDTASGSWAQPLGEPALTALALHDTVNRFGAYAAGYPWLDLDSPWRLYFTALIDNDTGKLRALGFDWSVLDQSPFVVDLTAQTLLRNLGPPHEMLVAVNQTSMSDLGRLNLLILYSEGISYYWDIRIPVFPTNEGFVVNYCLDEMTPHVDTSVLGRFFIMQPISDSTTQLTPIQRWIYGHQISDWEMRPVEEVFGLTPAEITEMAASQDNVCLSTNIVLE